MSEPATASKTQTTNEILGSSPTRQLLEDIFADLHPGLIDERRELANIFTPQSAQEFLGQLMNFEKLLSVDDTYEITVKKLQAQIDSAESVRDQLLVQIFEQIRPIETSYRQLMLFFENSKVPDGKVRKPVELYILNADPKAMQDVFSVNRKERDRAPEQHGKEIKRDRAEDHLFLPHVTETGEQRLN